MQVSGFVLTLFILSAFIISALYFLSGLFGRRLTDPTPSDAPEDYADKAFESIVISPVDLEDDAKGQHVYKYVER